ncbi:MAG: chemotaxis-specific protein-glutamate methyltransferase CheB [Treponema sp.]|jgi:two-component system chemotaxis response regulator CheB|nr:chemotaxis-specific protein-glutamate methyltransferase CheB [Treponema sp.]
MIRTLIVDDSSLVRSIIRDFLESDASFEIIGEAENGLEGINKTRELNPDLITMDIDMPVMNGLDAIVQIKNRFNSPVVVISTHDTAKTAYDATVLGAMEFFAKDIFTSQITDSRRKEVLNTLKQITGRKRTAVVSSATQARFAADYPAHVKSRQIKCIVIAASTGGPIALCQLFATLPEDMEVPILLVQHNTSGFDRGFTQWINGYTSLDVHLAEAGTIPVKGNIYVAPTDKHLVINERGIAFTDSEPVHNQKPAADLLFKSAAALYGQSLIGVVLTGMGADGADGIRSIRKSGGITIAQDEASSMIYGMPRAAAETGCVDIVLPLNEISQKLLALIRETRENEQ